MMVQSFSFRPAVLILILLLGLPLVGGGCGDSGNDKTSISSGTTTGGGGSGLAPAAISVTAGNRLLAAGGFTTTLTIIVTDNRGARTDATFYLTSSLGGNFVINGEKKGGTIVGTTTNGIFITTFESGTILGDTEIAAFIPGTTLRGTTTITLV
jgi:hypothetical protein